MRRTYKKSEESQEKVLDAAIQLLAEKGLSATTEEIASAAGLSKGSVHYHFSSKDELLLRVLDRTCTRIESRVRAAFEAPGTPLERIRRALTEMWLLRRDGSAEFRVLSELHVLARQDATVRAAMGRVYRTSREHIVEIGIQGLVGLGVRPRISLDVLPRLLIAALDGLALQHAVDPLTAEEEEALFRAVEVVSTVIFEL